MSNAISDIHLAPGSTAPDLHGLDSLILVGDTFNLLPWGLKAWWTPEGMKTAHSLFDQLPDDTRLGSGNHDPLPWLKKLIARYSERNFPAARYFDVGNRRFIHGHQYALDWWLLRHVADDVTETLTRCPLSRPVWYAFCKRMGWLASGMPSGAAEYPPFVGSVWAWALKRMHEKRRDFVIGHTHVRATLETPWHTLTDCGCNTLVEL